VESMGEIIQDGHVDAVGPTRSALRIAWVHGSNAGGSKRFAFEMVRALSARGHTIDEFAVRSPASNPDFLPLAPFVRTSTDLVVPSPNLSWMRPYLLGSYAQLGALLWANRKVSQEIRSLANKINATGYDFVHVDQYPSCRAVALLPELRWPTVVYSHEPSAVRYDVPMMGSVNQRQPHRRGAYQVLCDVATGLSAYVLDRRDIAQTRSANLILTNSCYSREVFFQRYGADSKVCYCGVDVSTFRPKPMPIEPMVLSVGRMVRPKQHHLIVDAVGRMAPGLRPRVVIATPEHVENMDDPVYRDELVCSAESKGVSLVVKHRASQQELVQLYRQALALVFLPVMEPLGLVALEAMACGTPVIGVKEAGVRESVLDRVTGILVEREASQVARAIVRLQQEPSMRQELSRQACEHVRGNWTWAHTIERYLAEVGKLIEPHIAGMSRSQPATKGLPHA
jgi:glycosyltransferase involved in cell wall biosynthesis